MAKKDEQPRVEAGSLPTVGDKDASKPAEPPQQDKPKPMRLSELRATPSGGGIRCPNCGCRDVRDELGPGWETAKSIPIPGGRRRRRICRNCGTVVRTVERLDKVIRSPEDQTS